MNIFLTGCTGFLGGKLLKNLLHGTTHHVYVLARNKQKAEQLKNSFPNNQQERIHIYIGDITLSNCGLNDNDINELEGKVNCFYHAAALVKFDLHLKNELFSINYDGTKNALELAKMLRVEKFFYISTAYTVGQKLVGTEQLYSPTDTYNNPYEESKVQSEHLVFTYANDMEVSIFRPSIIVGDSKTGEADSEFTLYGFMRALDIFKRKTMRKKGNENKHYRVIANNTGTSNFVPVDYVSDVLAMAIDKAEPNKIYNITNPNPPSNLELLSMLKHALKFEQLSIVNNDTIYELSVEEEKLNGMVDVFKVYLSRNITFKDDNTQKLISNSPIHHLSMSKTTIQMIIDAYFDISPKTSSEF
ncbi:nucleoside-diphosphate-sugar epimerase [Salirhabdus euzebyi]|uniref:Nucleoside-diphosphate-sugar epimerase n=1 Tax=Salirhabdus euzebyi TaxID=394506 RepID=A0A841Q4P1_9BACI|nr:SDR family oxidoreductase [Salirhabdus euzebyi]MBB6453381.1 nucleoside-diphosphate-sugar epimerase [Salirhabdus euzebyi]